MSAISNVITSQQVAKAIYVVAGILKVTAGVITFGRGFLVEGLIGMVAGAIILALAQFYVFVNQER